MSRSRIRRAPTSFCGTSLRPESGEILIAGGADWTGTEVSKVSNNESTIYAPGDDSLTRGAQMHRARWYASAVPLMNGEIYVQGGLHGEDFPEVRERDGSYRLLTDAPTGQYSFYYPRSYIAPDGRLFGYDTDGRMYFVMTDGTGSISRRAARCRLTGRPSTSVMYRPGRILQISAENNRAVTIDIDGATPVVSPTGSLSSRRAWANSTVLPDGRVLVSRVAAGSRTSSSTSTTVPKSGIQIRGNGRSAQTASTTAPLPFLRTVAPGCVSSLWEADGASIDSPLTTFTPRSTRRRTCTTHLDLRLAPSSTRRRKSSSRASHSRSLRTRAGLIA